MLYFVTRHGQMNNDFGPHTCRLTASFSRPTGTRSPQWSWRGCHDFFCSRTRKETCGICMDMWGVTDISFRCVFSFFLQIGWQAPKDCKYLGYLAPDKAPDKETGGVKLEQYLVLGPVTGQQGKERKQFPLSYLDFFCFFLGWWLEYMLIHVKQFQHNYVFKHPFYGKNMSCSNHVMAPVAFLVDDGSMAWNFELRSAGSKSTSSRSRPRQGRSLEFDEENPFAFFWHIYKKQPSTAVSMGRFSYIYIYIV